ncbi:MAG: hypothetical protein LBT01_08755 [Spirochaetaceae bacterium]|nr:hypothetical protein [Spirochaetaceae bacterium]
MKAQQAPVPRIEHLFDNFLRIEGSTFPTGSPTSEQDGEYACRAGTTTSLMALLRPVGSIT